MLTCTECLIQAENYELAARMAPEADRMALLEEAVIWRRRAFELQMLRFEHLREIPEESRGWRINPPPGQKAP